MRVETLNLLTVTTVSLIMIQSYCSWLTCWLVSSSWRCFQTRTSISFGHKWRNLWNLNISPASSAFLHSVTMFVIGSPLGLPLKQVSSGMLRYVTFLLPHLIAHPPTMYFIAFLLTLISLPRPLDGSKSSLSNYPQKKSLDCFLLYARDSCNEREGLHQSSHAVKHSLKIAITVRTNTRADSHAAKIIQREAE